MIQIKRHLSRTLFLIMFTILLVTPHAHASPGLDITVATDKMSYVTGEIVDIYANLTLDGSPVQDGLVALQVDNPWNNSWFYRTLQTGTPPTPNQINITEVITLDSIWQPKDTFSLGESGYVKITVESIIPPIDGDINGDYIVNVWDLSLLSDAWVTEIGDPNYNPKADLNNDGYINVWDLSLLSDYWLNEAPVLRVYLTMTMYDGENSPLITDLASFQIAPGASQTLMPQFQIPQTASTGNAAVYACAFTNFPKQGGIPYCPEGSKAFQITGSMSLSLNEPSSYQTTATSGNYNSTFKIPTNAYLGTYTVYVSSSYQQKQATDNTTFEVTAP